MSGSNSSTIDRKPRGAAGRKRQSAPRGGASRARATCGLFIVGTDTGVGKTCVAARIAAALAREGLQVGVYKPAASGCRRIGKSLVSDDALALWQAAGQPGELRAVCPQRFTAPLAPHLAAREERKEIDAKLLRSGIHYWRKRSDIVIVEGAGGLMSPVGERDYVADLAEHFGYPLIVVAPNRIGTINCTLLTLIAAAARPKPLTIAGIVLNDVFPHDSGDPDSRDPAVHFNRMELETRCVPPVLAHLAYDAADFDAPVDWLRVARGLPHNEHR